MALYKVYNGISPTSSLELQAVATGTSLKTHMQIKPGATQIVRICEWGVSFNGAAAAASIQCELLETDVAATGLTAYVAGDFNKFDEAALLQGNPTTSMFSLGTSASGYGLAGAEGSITASRMFDVQFVQPTNQTFLQFPLGYRAVLQPALFGRIRIKAPASVNAITYMLLEV